MSIELPKPRYHYMSLLCFYISTAYDCFSGSGKTSVHEYRQRLTQGSLFSRYKKQEEVGKISS